MEVLDMPNLLISLLCCLFLFLFVCLFVFFLSLFVCLFRIASPQSMKGKLLIITFKYLGGIILSFTVAESTCPRYLESLQILSRLSIWGWGEKTREERGGARGGRKTGEGRRGLCYHVPLFSTQGKICSGNVIVFVTVLEPCRLFPSRIRISRRNQANMLQKVKVSSLYVLLYDSNLDLFSFSSAVLRYDFFFFSTEKNRTGKLKRRVSVQWFWHDCLLVERVWSQRI